MNTETGAAHTLQIGGTFTITDGTRARIFPFDASEAEIGVFIEERLVEAFRASPDVQRLLRREDARFLYGTRAIKQPPSRHARSRREKRRTRKAKRG